MKNIKEFKELVKKYKSITIEEIENADTAKELTGCGNVKTCTLCIPLHNEHGSPDCSVCVWETETGLRCGEDNYSKPENSRTYLRMLEAETPTELLAAFKERAKYMEQVLSKNTD